MILFVIIALPAAGLYCSLLEAPFALPILAALLQLRHAADTAAECWCYTEMIAPIHGNHQSAFWWWLGWRMALPKFTWGAAEPCPALQGEEPLAGAVEQCCTKCVTTRISASPSLNSGWGQVPNGATAPLSALLGARETLWWSVVKHSLWESQQMIPHAFTGGGNGGTTKVPRSAFVTICIAGRAAASFPEWGKQMNGTCTCF